VNPIDASVYFQVGINRICNGRIFLFFNARFLKAFGYVPGCGLGEWDELANSQIQELKNEGRMEDLENIVYASGA
jgi:hypothetical protein